MTRIFHVERFTCIYDGRRRSTHSRIAKYSAGSEGAPSRVTYDGVEGVRAVQHPPAAVPDRLGPIQARAPSAARAPVVLDVPRAGRLAQHAAAAQQSSGADMRLGLAVDPARRRARAAAVGAGCLYVVVGVAVDDAEQRRTLRGGRRRRCHHPSASGRPDCWTESPAELGERGGRRQQQRQRRAVQRYVHTIRWAVIRAAITIHRRADQSDSV